MQITQISLKNFRAFQDVEMRDIPRFAVLVGANGTGKSTLFQVFGFLRDAMTTNVSTALAKLGGRSNPSRPREAASYLSSRTGRLRIPFWPDMCRTGPSRCWPI